MQPDLITVEELAKLLRVSPSAVHSARYRGELPASLGIRIGRRVLFRRADIEAHLAELAAETAGRVQVDR